MVKRYILWDDFGRIHPDECDVDANGDWVIYDDYAALLAENERLKAERVDLERFRPAVEKARAECLTQGFENYCNELLAMIDAHKGE